MFCGIAAGATWAVETIILGIALSMAPFVSTEQAIFLAPFVSTFIHDAFSALWAALYNGVRGNLKNVYKAAFKTKSGKFVMLAAVIGGPIGMTGYVLAINYMGASIGAVASAVFPAAHRLSMATIVRSLPELIPRISSSSSSATLRAIYPSPLLAANRFFSV